MKAFLKLGQVSRETRGTRVDGETPDQFGYVFYFFGVPVDDCTDDGTPDFIAGGVCAP